MHIEFIDPNWHVILIHYPLALLTLGLIAEIVSMAWPRSGLRVAGRWMMGLGALLAIPVVTSGLWAFQDVVNGVYTGMDPWHDVVASSSWSAAQWEFIHDHILYNGIAAGIAVIIVFVWLASSDQRRRKFYWFMLVGMIAVNILLIIGSWHGGELVYRFGTAVAATNHHPQSPAHRDVSYWAPPLQVHAVLAGFTVSALVLALALSFRKWGIGTPAAIGDVLRDEPPARPLDPGATHPREPETLILPPRVYPGWFYLLGFVLAVLTAFFGYWSFNLGNAFSGGALRDNVHTLGESDHRRVLAHVVAGVLIIILPLILGLIVRIMRGNLVAMILMVILVLTVAVQVWLGIALLFDGHEGPLWRFNTAEARTEAPAPHNEHEAAPSTNPPAHRAATLPSAHATTRP